ncbi:MAG: nitroreductase family protein [Deltaproteobacteria bacterium]|nr:nitroreductase family protein [Deltaproteobacteria bacterium]MBW2309114.1 nitroreductase family protein [Deltaproteobacteria bacterium]
MGVIHSLYREPAKVEIDERTCKRCGQCTSICPGEVLTMKDGSVRIRGDSPFGCIACGHCMMVCPEDSVRVTGRGISPEDLLLMPSSEERATVDELGALMRARRSVRRFKEKEVEPELLDRIVDMAASGPMGIPPWDVGCVTVRGQDKVRELADEIIKGYEKFLKIFKPWVFTLMHPFVRQATYQRFKYFIRPLAETYVGCHHEGRDVLFYDAPAVMVFHYSPYADLADATIACVYAMLASESLGLGNTIIGGAAPILQRNKALCQRLGIPEGNTPAIALILGYPATKFRRAIRRSFAAVNTIC